MGDIIISDETMGQSFAYTPTAAGYFAAAAKIDEITQLEHKVGGDVGRVRAFTG